MVKILRFAPSPTGDLHIGSVRTLIFNYIYSLKNKGKLILRIDDTDLKRSEKIFEDFIFEAARFLGIEFDAIYRQSERKDLYKRKAEEISKTGRTYYCQCDKGCIGQECIDRRNLEGALRLIAPERASFTDLNFGQIEVQMENFALTRNNGEALYLFASAIDDIDMGITDIIRGTDHIMNAAKQIEIFKLLGRPLPNFIHIPLIHDKDNSKLSKRKDNGIGSFKDMIKMGFIKEGIINFLAKLGWSSRRNVDYFRIEDILDEFIVENFGKSPAIFNISKLEKINKHHMKAIGLEEIKRRYGDLNIDDQLFEILINRASTILDLYRLAKVFEEDYLKDFEKKFECKPEELEFVKGFLLQENPSKEEFDEKIKAKSLDKGECYRIGRILILFEENGIDFFLVLRKIPRDKYIERINFALKNHCFVA